MADATLPVRYYSLGPEADQAYNQYMYRPVLIHEGTAGASWALSCALEMPTRPKTYCRRWSRWSNA